jgi:DNA topoisomerase-1
MAKLVIVESHAKVKTIKKFLGRGYKVEASVGHIRDLPKSSLGIDLGNDFEPKYITIRGKGELVSKLKKEAKGSDEVLLATDPDREGEAISWHLAHLLGIDGKRPCRIEFNEITDSAVKNAIKNPRPISLDLVDAQQARRVLDRIVGYQISPILWRKVKSGLSAGRVQSVAVRLICEREREITEFVPQEYWTITANLTGLNLDISFEALFHGQNNKKIELKSKEEVDRIINALKGADFIVKSIKKQDKKRNAPPPFITSTLQQEASRKLGFTTKKTMMLAQQLYEGVEMKGGSSEGLVTYIRTDSMRVSSNAQSEALEYIARNYGKQYVPEVPNRFKSKKNIQDAHECIRPANLSKDPESIKDSLKKDQYRLYKLIYERFLASQMTPAVYEVTSADIEAGGYLFKSSASKLIFKGYTVIYEEGSDSDKKEKDTKLPELKEGDKLRLIRLSPEQHFTEPPMRYTEASLVKMLEEMGIGRPSTYAPTISTIIDRGYVLRDKKSLFPTELGFIVNDLMVEFFKGVVDYKFTADMENRLDQVEEGAKNWKDILREFYPSFEAMLKEAENNIGEVTLSDEQSDIDCDKCGAKMVFKRSRFGKFLACPNYPDCRNTKSLQEDLDVLCPVCNSRLTERNTKKGKKFYGCSKYPDCNFMSWDLPSGENCPECGSYMVFKENKKRQKYHACSNKSCKHKSEQNAVN